jgi:glycosyltransferase involved in cell wall biosynthesis
MPSPLQASVLVAVTITRPELRRTLLGLAAQTRRDFEVLLCDDGSGPAIAALARELRPLFPGGLRHLWQPDAGFRKCRILNAGVRRAGADYLVVLDADCVPHHAFVAAIGARAGPLSCRRRVEMDRPGRPTRDDLIRRRRIGTA